MELVVRDRWWVLHEEAIAEALVRVYTRDIDPAEALALMEEQSELDQEAE